MPRHKSIPPLLRRQVAKQDRYRCSYCCSPEVVGVTLVIDHIIPLVAGGGTVMENLTLSCYRCNSAKGVSTEGIDPKTGELVQLFHPRQQEWHKHFEWGSGGLVIVGKTAIGRATVDALGLNDLWLVTARKIWIVAGVHPPLE